MITKEQVRAKKFARAYIETGGNATQAYKEINPQVKYSTANVEGFKQLVKPSVQREITELLPSNEVESGVIKEALSTRTPTQIKWSEKHAYLETSLKLKGLLKDKQPGNTNIAIVLNAIDSPINKDIH